MLFPASLTKHGYKMNTKEKKEFNIQFWRFLWASTLIGLSACLGNVVDAMIVGNLIDEDAVSAINLSLPFVQFMFTVNMLLATGAVYTIMIVYKLYNHHHMALFISFALSLTVIPVLWLFSLFAEEWIWYGFLTAYIIEMVAIFVLHKMTHVKFELTDTKQ